MAWSFLKFSWNGICKCLLISTLQCSFLSFYKPKMRGGSLPLSHPLGTSFFLFSTLLLSLTFLLYWKIWYNSRSNFSIRVSPPGTSPVDLWLSLYILQVFFLKTMYGGTYNKLITDQRSIHWIEPLYKCPHLATVQVSAFDHSAGFQLIRFDYLVIIE